MGAAGAKFQLLTILSDLEFGSRTMFMRLEIHQTERAEIRPSANLKESSARGLHNWTLIRQTETQCFAALILC